MVQAGASRRATEPQRSVGCGGAATSMAAFDGVVAEAAAAGARVAVQAAQVVQAVE